MPIFCMATFNLLDNGEVVNFAKTGNMIETVVIWGIEDSQVTKQRQEKTTLL